MKKTHFMDDFWMGPGTYQIKAEMYAQNRNRLVERIKSKGINEGTAILLQGASLIPIYDGDVDYAFRQESFCLWAFGIQEPGCFGMVDLQTGKVVGFFPKPNQDDFTWIGPPVCLGTFQTRYKLDEARYCDDLEPVLKQYSCRSLLILKGVNSDSGLLSSEVSFDGIANFCVNTRVLYEEIADLRSVKTDLELELLRYVIGVSSEAHKEVMLFAKPGRYQYQCEAEFSHHCYSKGGCKHIAYNCSCASGKYASILHYGHALRPNDYIIKDGDICCFDMGASYFGYTADITCSYPANGKFTNDQKIIYEAVLESNMAVAKNAKPGVTWDSMHLLANMVLLKKLKEAGLLQGSLDDMMKVDLAYTFQPHGLGHLLGMDVHDVGGYLSKYPPKREGKSMQNLRMARPLEKGMVLTIEPGCYFIDVLLDQALTDCVTSKFLVLQAIERFRGFGGVRIEDDVLITETGVEILNSVPRTVQEIEEWMSKRKDV